MDGMHGSGHNDTAAPPRALNPSDSAPAVGDAHQGQRRATPLAWILQAASNPSQGQVHPQPKMKPHNGVIASKNTHSTVPAAINLFTEQSAILGTIFLIIDFP
ncbi:MAG: hypothetical protein ACU837_01895 [Gammaproteobacteria bacterium]